MSVSTGQALVATTGQTLIYPGGTPGSTPGTSLIVTNNGPTNAVYLGGPGVTTSNGFQLAAGASINLGHVDGNALYGVAVTGAVTVSYFTTT